MLDAAPPTYFLSRRALLRGLGFVYAVAFLILVRQGDGLIGSHGILPVAHFLHRVRSAAGPSAFWRLPSLFWLDASDAALGVGAVVGLGLAIGAMAGFGNAVVFAALWVLYLSFVHVGQVFYGYGWELLTVEAGFLAIFYAPPRGFERSSDSAPPLPVVFLYRWLLFRVMFGAGLIKLRGDPCWTALTCLADHYETQPNPSPLSYFLDGMPGWFHASGVLVNHVAELLAPWCVFGPRRVRHLGGTVIVVFQTLLILSGNLAFLNWLTIVIAIACFDDAFLERWLPGRIRRRLKPVPEARPPSPARRNVVVVLTIVVSLLSLAPVLNMLSPGQAMNESFDPLDLVNTYGAFGSVDHERHEVVIEGTRDDALAANARWVEYEFPCKPGDPRRPPCLVTPYHYRLDWQMWFAGHRDEAGDVWFFRLIHELVRGNRHVTALLAKDPFRDAPPRYVRALLYRYRFTHDLRQGFWHRDLLGEYLRPVARDDADLNRFLERRGFP